MTARRIPDGDRALFRRACNTFRALTAKGYDVRVGADGSVQLRTLTHGLVETVHVPGMSGGSR